MVQIQSPVRRLVSQLVLISALLPPGTQGARAQKFFPDDPVWVEPKPRPVEELPVRTTGVLYDFLRHSFAGQVPPPTAARGVNTLGGVPDNAWFTNRHAVRRMAIAELKRRSGTDSPPGAPFTVIGAKTDGITPGFRMQDAAGRLYFVKPDPRSNPEMATAADVIVSRFFHALGYFTPQNYLLYLKRSDIKVSPDARVDGLGGKRRVMMERDLDDILREVPRRKDGTYRMVASLAAQGTPIGPFRYEGTRSDDPHDTIPHEYRRELRGLFVLCSWLNHTDA
jgi:hypothetical protein